LTLSCISFFSSFILYSFSFFFFLTILRPPRSTLFPYNDALPISYCRIGERSAHTWFVLTHLLGYPRVRNYDGSWTEWGNLVKAPDRKSTRLNSSHRTISYAVFCLKKKKKKKIDTKHINKI